MIIKILRSKGRIVSKESKKGDVVYYVETLLNGKKRKLLIKNAKEFLDTLELEKYLPVYGEIVFYSKLPGQEIQTEKFRIKGIDKHPDIKVRPRIKQPQKQ